MNKTNLKVTPAAIFIFFMQLLYAAASSEVSQSEVYIFIWIGGYLIAGIMAVLACFISSINLSQIIKISFVGILMIVTALSSAGRELALLVLYWIILKNSNQDQLIKTFFCADILALYFNALLALVGAYHIFDDSGNLILGFLNPNFLGLFVFDIVLLLIVQNDKKQNLKNFSIIMIAALLCWKYINCRSAALAIVILVVLSLMRGILEGNKLFLLGVKYSYVILSGLSIALGKIGVSNAILMTIDKVLSGRIIAWNVYFQNKPITLLGTLFYARDFYPLDNAYLWLLFRYGVIVFVIYAVANYLVSKKAIEQKTYNMQIVILALAFYSLMEFSPMSVFNHIGLALLTAKSTNASVQRKIE